MKTNGMLVKIQNDQKMSSWVHRTHLRYVPDRPLHLQQILTSVPVPQITISTPPPPSGGPSPFQNLRSGVSRIPKAISIRPGPIVNARRSMPNSVPAQKPISTIQNRLLRRPMRKTIANPPPRPVQAPSRPLPISARPTRASLLRSSTISAQRNVPTTRSLPPRNRQLPAKLRSGDYVMK